MPIYEFYSPDTRKIYTFYSRSLQSSSITPICPCGKNFKMQKMYSGFSVTGSSSKKEELEETGHNKSEGDPFANMSEKQASQVMQELEKNLGGMDDENPDPRQMGKMMRKMCELTGEKMDGVMEEVVRKLEEGANPEELEEKMGGQMEEMESEDNGADASEDKGKKLRSRNLPVTRDPVLYEMQDFIR
jgi:truncated hemoglobin YjbI